MIGAWRHRPDSPPAPRAIGLAILVLLPVLQAVEPVPLPQAHAHNDYEHARPLLDALDAGFGSVEADVWLVDGELRVAHNLPDTRPGRTLTSLYLDPLQSRVRRQSGRVYPDGTPILLLVDVKSAAAPTYAVLHEVLSRYADLLTVFRRDGRRAGPVTVIVSGNRDEAGMQAQAVRYAALDGRKVHLASEVSADLVPLISENWRQLSSWNWSGPMPEATRNSLQAWVAQAHARGRMLRFWNVPDRPDVWQQLLAAGVDLLGADDLAALRRFLLGTPVPRGKRP